MGQSQSIFDGFVCILTIGFICTNGSSSGGGGSPPLEVTFQAASSWYLGEPGGTSDGICEVFDLVCNAPGLKTVSTKARSQCIVGHLMHNDLELECEYSDFAVFTPFAPFIEDWDPGNGCDVECYAHLQYVNGGTINPPDLTSLFI